MRSVPSNANTDPWVARYMLTDERGYYWSVVAPVARSRFRLEQFYTLYFNRHPPYFSDEDKRLFQKFVQRPTFP